METENNSTNNARNTPTIDIVDDIPCSESNPIIIEPYATNNIAIQNSPLQCIIEKKQMTNRTGLFNSGNDCFINSAIQCLAVSPFIHTFIKRYQADDSKMIKIINKYNLGKLKSNEMEEYINGLLEQNLDIDIYEQRVLKHVAKHSGDIFIYTCFKELINNLHSRNYRTITCNTLITVFQEISQSTGFEHLFNGEQNDPHEFMAYILDKVHNAKSSKVSIDLPENYDKLDPYFKLYLQHFRARYQNDFSMFVKTFYYYIINCIECNQCKKRSFEVSPNDIMCVSLPTNWQTNNHITLDECISEMFKVEGIDYKCEHCGNIEHNRMDRKIITKPRTLIIKIKRYAQVRNSLFKINKMIHYPETLTISQYFCGVNMQDYHLYAVINHIGVIGGGHYYSYVKDYNKDHQFEDKWYLCNDSNVREIPETEVMNSQNAYMLFYHSNN